MGVSGGREGRRGSVAVISAVNRVYSVMLEEAGHRGNNLTGIVRWDGSPDRRVDKTLRGIRYFARHLVLDECPVH